MNNCLNTDKKTQKNMQNIKKGIAKIKKVCYTINKIIGAPIRASIKYSYLHLVAGEYI